VYVLLEFWQKIMAIPIICTQTNSLVVCTQFNKGEGGSKVGFFLDGVATCH